MTRFDAVVVATDKPALCLRYAALVAARLGCPLVVVCDGRLSPAAEIPRRIGDTGATLVTIDLSHPWTFPVAPAPSPSTSPDETAALLDGLKRNVGQLLAWMAGWERVIFLDDDAVLPDTGDLPRVARLLDGCDRVTLAPGAVACATIRAPACFTPGDAEEWFAYLRDTKSGYPLGDACTALAAELALHPAAVTVERHPRTTTTRLPDRLTVPGGPAVLDPASDSGFLTVRRLAKGDVNALVETFGQAEYFDRAAGVRQPQGHGDLLVVWDGDTPVGDVYLWLAPAEEEILRTRLPGVPLLTHLEIVPERRGRGIGAWLVHQAERFLRERSHARVALGVDLANIRAFDLYSRIGYEVWGDGPILTREEILHADGTVEHRTERCHIMVANL